MAYLETRKVPRVLIPCIRSKRFMSVCGVVVSEMALALLTTMSRPPKRSAVRSIASFTAASSRTSTTSGSARPPASEEPAGCPDRLPRLGGKLLRLRHGVRQESRGRHDGIDEAKPQRLLGPEGLSKHQELARLGETDALGQQQA